MKIRADFVTNSSSSSYVLITVTGLDDLYLECELEEYEVHDQPNLLEAKTARQIGQALCDEINGGINEEDMPEELEELIAQLEQLPSLDEVTAITVENTDFNWGEFVEAHLDDFECIEDPNDVDYLEITAGYETNRKLQCAWSWYTTEVNLTDEAEERLDLDWDQLYYSQNYSPREITVPAQVQSLEQEDLQGCDNLEKLIFAGDVETISEKVFGNLPKLAAIIAPKMPPSKFQKKGKLLAVLGFAQQNGQDYEYRVEYLRYIKSQRKRLMPVALEHMELLRLMLAEKLIPAKELPDWLDQAQGSQQALEALQEYAKRA